MKLFQCPACGQRLYFENTRCERCGCVLGYRSETASLTALGALGGSLWRALDGEGGRYRLCANAAWDACNWLVPADSEDAHCRACRLNRTIPDLRDPDNLMRWRVLERAKHRLVYSLIDLGLPLTDRFRDPGAGLAFDFLAAGPDGVRAVTGHANGVITLAVEEADDVERERHRNELAEPYRTVLGHLRHEVGHYYWDRLVTPGVLWTTFRELFGDERAPYAEALARHYETGPPDDWRDRYVSTYASAHPWEDFAETWAHYLHIYDTLETANWFGVRLDIAAGDDAAAAEPTRYASLDPRDFDALTSAWSSLTHALNCLSLSMGQPETYPFVLSPGALGKMRFVHGLIHGDAARP
ncbi:MAG: zinc-binding metallopeptidase family protein [Oceanicaulis sp.]